MSQTAALAEPRAARKPKGRQQVSEAREAATAASGESLERGFTGLRSKYIAARGDFVRLREEKG